MIKEEFMSWLLKDESDGVLGRLELEREIEEHISKLVTEARAAIANAKAAEENAKLAAQAVITARKAVADTCAAAAHQGFHVRWDLQTFSN
jgi:hypothetical protein